MTNGTIRAMAIAVAFNCVAAAAAFAAPVLVHVAQGDLRGSADDKVARFLDVPFAAPPVGDLRWAPPKPAPAWTGVREATAIGSPCMQDAGDAARGGKAMPVGSEDCLHLDIYAPQGAAKPRPVLIWVHGGNSIAGDSADIDGSALANRDGIVVVSVNYRLGALGFLTLPQLDRESPRHTSGNYALLDQRAALEWVKANIAAFGGDPDNINLAGQSAGGWYIWIDLADGAMRPLIKRAVVLSGLTALDGVKADEQKTGASGGFLAASGCASAAGPLACLRALPAQTVVQKGVFSWVSGMRWRPIVDGVLVPGTIVQRAPAYLGKMPLMAQGVAEEGGSAVRLRHGNGEAVWGAEAFAAYLKRIPYSAEVKAEYPLSSFKTGDEAYIKIVSDERSCEIVRFHGMAAGGAPFLLSEFDDPQAPATTPNPPEPKVGAFHASDIQYVFQSGYPRKNFPAGAPFTPSQVALSDRMMDRIGRFVRGELDHAPTDKVLVYRPAGDTSEPVAAFAQRHHCAFWLKLEPTVYLQ